MDDDEQTRSRAPEAGWQRRKLFVHRVWQSLWRMHSDTKAYVTLDAPGIAAHMDASSPAERRLVRNAFAAARVAGGQDEESKRLQGKGNQRGGDTPPRSGENHAEGDTSSSSGENRTGGTGPPGGGGSGGSHAGGGDGNDGQDGEESPFDVGGEYGRRQKVGFVLGPLLFALILLAPTPDGLAMAGQATAAVTVWVAVWWISEAIPIPATSLLPIVLFPLTGALPLAETSPAYANPLIFLFMGGFFLAMAMQRWGLHRRIALRTIKAVGTQPSRIILGFMIATAFLSMWVSNSATVMMMVPIALAVIYQTGDLIEESKLDIETGEGEFAFGVSLMLCIAYSASVGGVATLIGTPPNLLFAGQAGELFGESIGFAEWMLYGVPIAVIGLVGVYVYVTRLAITPQFDQLPAGAAAIDDELARLGSTSRQERLVLVVFVGMALSWIGASLVDQAGLLPVPDDVDSLVAIAGAMLLFSIPTRTKDGNRTFLLDWTTGVKIPWGVILLFGGGLAIAAAFGETGLAVWIGEQLEVLEGTQMLVILLAVVTMTVFLTEMTSNTATTAMLMPILAGVAVGINVHPFGLMIAAATAASFAFMLPVATPPNAIVFGSGYITIPQMAKVGVGLNLLGIILITLLAVAWLPLVWGIDVTALPPEFVEAWGG